MKKGALKSFKEINPTLKTTYITITIIIILLLVYFLAGITGITGRATAEEIREPCNADSDFKGKCTQDAGVEACIIKLGEDAETIYSDAEDCIDKYLSTFPGNRNLVNNYADCAGDFSEGLITQAEWNTCKSGWTSEEPYQFTYDEGLVEISKIKTGFYFPTPSGLAGRVNIYDENNKLYVYNSVRHFWHDLTEETFTGVYYDASQLKWCDVRGRCGVLPESLVIKTGYWFTLGQKDGRINLYGEAEVDGEIKPRLMIYNPNKGVWFDKSEITFTGGAGNLPEDFSAQLGFANYKDGKIWLFDTGGNLYTWQIWGQPGWSPENELLVDLTSGSPPVVGYWSPFEYGRVNIFYENRDYYVREGSSVYQTMTLEDLGLPGVPEAGYYDDLIEVEVLWYDSQAYTRAEDENIFTLNERYIIEHGESLAAIQDLNDINNNIDRSSWDPMPVTKPLYNTIDADMLGGGIEVDPNGITYAPCEEEVVIACKYSNPDGFGACSDFTVEAIKEKISMGTCDNPGEFPKDIREKMQEIEENVQIYFDTGDASYLPSNAVCTGDPIDQCGFPDLTAELEERGYMDEYMQSLSGSIKKGNIRCEAINYNLLSLAEYETSEFERLSYEDDYGQNILGDVNGDGAIDTYDVDAIGKVLAGTIKNPHDECIMDVKTNGIIDMEDVIELARLVGSGEEITQELCGNKNKVLVVNLIGCKGQKYCDFDFIECNEGDAECEEIEENKRRNCVK